MHYAVSHIHRRVQALSGSHRISPVVPVFQAIRMTPRAVLVTLATCYSIILRGGVAVGLSAKLSNELGNTDDTATNAIGRVCRRQWQRLMCIWPADACPWMQPAHPGLLPSRIPSTR